VAPTSTTVPVIPDHEYDKADLLRHEREMLGLYVSDHPLFGTERVLERATDTTCLALREKDDGASVTVGGVLTGMQKKFTKKGDTYLVATLEDLSGNTEVTFWPQTYRAAHEVLVEDAVLIVTGKVEKRDEAVKLLANRVSAPDLSEALGSPVVVTFAAEQCTADAVRRLRSTLAEHAGVVPVHLRLRDPDGGSGCSSSVTTCGWSGAPACSGRSSSTSGRTRSTTRWATAPSVRIGTSPAGSEPADPVDRRGVRRIR
jgi:DNA polymerase III subunit alpha